MHPPPTTPVRRRAELDWIDWIRRRGTAGAHDGNSDRALRLGIGDDCAILRPPAGHELLVTTDFSLEGRHFRRDWHPSQSAGHRTLARGLSDLAAMGAQPLAAFLSLALPARDAQDPAWAEGFLEGLFALADRFKTPLAGGDTSQAPGMELLADIVLLGSAPAGTALRRSGARPGDGLYVSGTLGGAAAELAALETSTHEHLGGDHPQLFPEPRLALGDALRRSGLVTACMDLSDGLSTDLAHLCAASEVGALVQFERLPASAWLRNSSSEERARLLLHGGEDYELLFTAGPEADFPERIAGLPVTRIGSIVPRQDREGAVTLQQGDQKTALLPGGWEHLS